MNILLRRALALVIILGALLYIPYGLYTAKRSADLAATATAVRGVVLGQDDEIVCRKIGRGNYACDAAIIAQTNTTPPWTGRVVMDTSLALSRSSATAQAKELLVAIKPRDPVALHAVTQGDAVSYISEDGLRQLKYDGDPTNDLYLLFSPLFMLLGAAAFFDKLSRRW